MSRNFFGGIVLCVSLMSASGVSNASVQSLEEACSAGDIPSCIDLGAAYMNSQGVERNDRRAVALFIPACQANHVVACFNLGLLVEGGRGGQARDLVRAYNLYEKACVGGFQVSCNRMQQIQPLAQREYQRRIEEQARQDVNASVDCGAIVAAGGTCYLYQ